METMTLSQILDAASKLSTEQQLELNRALCVLIKNKRKVAAAVAGTKFYPTQVVSFNAKTRGIKFMKIEKFNRAGTAVVGRECHSNGTPMEHGVRWTVSTNLCLSVTL
jgi:hypothetical protein